MIFDISMIYHSIFQHKHQISMGNSMGKALHFFLDPEVCGHKISMHRSDLAMRTMTDFLEELVQFWVWGHADSEHEDPIKSNNGNMAIEESLTIIYIYIYYLYIHTIYIHIYITYTIYIYKYMYVCIEIQRYLNKTMTCWWFKHLHLQMRAMSQETGPAHWTKDMEGLVQAAPALQTELMRSAMVQLWPWLLLITGYFYGIIHSINGVLLVLKKLV